MSGLEDGLRLLELYGEATELADAGDAEAAERLLHDLRAEASGASMPNGRAITRDGDHLLADLLARREAFDEAEAILAELEATEATADEARRVRSDQARLADQRGDHGRAEERFAAAIGAARAAGASHRLDLIAAQRELAGFYADRDRRADADAVTRAADAASRELVFAYFAADRRPAVVRLAEGARPFTDAFVRELSHGAVTEPAALDPDGRPVPGGLHCCRIFGPLADDTCLCGSLSGPADHGRVCAICHVEAVAASVRTWRAGHIALPTPVLHPMWKALVLELLDTTAHDFLTRPDRKVIWRDRTYELFDDLPGVHPSELQAMLLDALPVVPPDGPLALDRRLVDDAYLAVMTGPTDAFQLQRAVDELFALLAHG
ncbi:MAG: hypothetical protein KIT31_16965 [Deltaproteobacteria bacterium]|nr:hypothetical protein [Deltaproteobacteria bacterium]